MGSLPSSIDFYSFLQYSPRGGSPPSKLSSQITYAAKNDSTIKTSAGDVPAIASLVERIALKGGDQLKAIFGKNTLVVPVPRSGLMQAGSLWPTKRICEELVKAGLAWDICECIERVSAVRKSSTAGPGERPGPEEHFASTSVLALLIPFTPSQVVLVDDVITRGSTLLGIYPHMMTLFGKVAPIRLFALIRTVDGEIETMVAPVKGVIKYKYGKLSREP